MLPSQREGSESEENPQASGFRRMSSNSRSGLGFHRPSRLSFS